MDATLVMDAQSSKAYTFDFSPDLPSNDATVKAIAAGDSSVDAFNFAGTDVGSTILSSKSVSGKTITAVIGSLTLGQEYRVRFVVEGTTSGQRFTKWLQVLCRQEGEAEF